MQAQEGDAPATGDGDLVEANIDGLHASARALKQLKLDAWRAEKGKGRETAMQEYVTFLTSIAPHWKVASILQSKSKEPRAMKWVLRITCGDASGDKDHATAVETQVQSSSVKSFANSNSRTLSRKSSQSAFHFRACALEVLQFTDDANARLFNNDSVAVTTKGTGSRSTSPNAVEKTKVTAAKGVSSLDGFMANMPTDLQLVDCILDKAKHNTIDEQRYFYEKRMTEMAREGKDDEDGWEFYRKTFAEGVCDEDQLDIYSRKVPWSKTRQLRTRNESDNAVAEIYASLIEHWVTNSNSLYTKVAKHVLGTSSTEVNMHQTAVRDAYLVFAERRTASATALTYRIFTL